MANGSLLSEDFAPGQLPAGPQGPQGVQGVQGPAGQNGSPDTGADILSKLAPIDGSGSGLDADFLDGLNAGAFALAGHNHDATYVNEGQGDSVTAGMIANPTRAISIPLSTFFECDTAIGGADGFIDFVNASGDAEPDFVQSGSDGGGIRLQWDADATSDEETLVCSQITAPPDYVSGGTVRIRAVRPLPLGGQAEQVACAISFNTGAPTAPLFAAGALGGGPSSFDCGPFGGVAPNDAIGIAILVGNDDTTVGDATTIDDAVDVLSVEFVYTAAQ